MMQWAVIGVETNTPLETLMFTVALFPLAPSPFRPGGVIEARLKGDLLPHFCCFLANSIQESFFLTFTRFCARTLIHGIYLVLS